MEREGPPPSANSWISPRKCHGNFERPRRV